MAFDKLPEEILVRILSFLPLSDLLESALTCRRWAQAVAAPPLLRNVWLVIEDMKEAGSVFANTRRQYENLRLDAGPLLDFDAAFWTNVGPRLRKLELLSSCSSEVLCSILQICCNLESLRLGKRRGFLMYFKTKFPSGINVKSIQESTRNLHHLDFDFGGLHIDTLKYLLVLMPNVSSVALRTAESEPNFLSLLSFFLGTSRRITMLELDSSGNGEEFEQLLRTSSTSLRELLFHSRNSTLRAFKALKYCTMLRHLSIDCWELDAGHLQEILGSVPELESLGIRYYRIPLTREDLVPLFGLKKLRKLHLHVKLESDSNLCVSEELLREIARMLPLETLVVQDEAVDSTGLRFLASLPKLRNLNLALIKWDAESLRIILFELRKPRKLTIFVDSWGWTYPWFAGDSEVDPQSLASVDRFGSDGQDELESSSLEVLKLFDIPLTDADLSQIAAHHTRLKVLHLTACDIITDAGLVTLLQHEPLLEELELNANNNLYGEFLEALGELPCRRLHSIRIHPRDVITSQAWEAFKLRKPRVKLVHIR